MNTMYSLSLQCILLYSFVFISVTMYSFVFVCIHKALLVLAVRQAMFHVEYNDNLLLMVHSITIRDDIRHTFPLGTAPDLTILHHHRNTPCPPSVEKKLCHDITLI